MNTLKPVPRRRFYADKVPSSSKVRRVPGSPSFRKQGIGEYIVIQNGKKIKLTAKVTKETAAEQHTVLIIELRNPSDQEIGNAIIDLSRNTVNIHRNLHQQYRGYNLGKLLLRLTEQEAAKLGRKEMTINTDQQDTITTALSIGYTPTQEGTKHLKLSLHIPLNEPLPPTRVLIEKLKEHPILNMRYIELNKKITP